MAGDRKGGLKTAAYLKSKDPDYYRKIGKMSHAAWVENGKKPKGFAAVPGLAKRAGIQGGRVSRRRKKSESK